MAGCYFRKLLKLKIMNYKITIEFEIQSDENKLNEISQILEATIENHVNLQSLVKIEIDKL